MRGDIRDVGDKAGALEIGADRLSDPSHSMMVRAVERDQYVGLIRRVAREKLIGVDRARVKRSITRWIARRKRFEACFVDDIPRLLVRRRIAHGKTSCSQRAARCAGRNRASTWVQTISGEKTMKNLVTSFVLIATVACGGAPSTEGERATLQQKSASALQSMIAKDATLPALLSSSAGYIVFPEIGKGGFIAGAAHGRGVLYERGQPTGYVVLNEASIGAQIGAQSFSEL
ncbi:MAG TPA: hypothetical protein VIV11_41330, partial [Kofleriaceae bacterium]